jgi:hypothetical protein
MLHAAEMYGASYRFRDTKHLADSDELVEAAGGALAVVTNSELEESDSRLLAFDNLSGAKDVYGFRPGRDFAVVVGNERRGISHRIRSMASDTVHVPMHSKRINTLNVAAASAVALHYLLKANVGGMKNRRNPGSRRPELLLVGPDNHFELGSSIRSAAAFGWSRAFIEDREGIWFGADRVTLSEGRAAARRSRNRIRLVPSSAEASHGFSKVTIVTAGGPGIPLHRANMARGQQQLIVIPDEGRVDVGSESWSRLGREVEFVSLDTPIDQRIYHYRLVATIAMAEIARQVGRGTRGGPARRRHAPVYDRDLDLALEVAGEDVWLEDLLDY